MARRIAIRGYNGDITIDPRILRAMAYGTQMSEEDSFAQMDLFAALGGRVFDTAAVYGNFDMKGAHKAEETIGKWLKRQPDADEFRVITKGGHFDATNPDVSRVTPECIAEDLTRSLVALGIDAIDVYLLHRDNPAIPVGELMECLNVFVRQGKIRAIGAANWTAARIIEANEYAMAHGLQPFTCSEVLWGLAVPYEHEGDQARMTKDEYNAYLDMDIAVLAEDPIQNGMFGDDMPDNFKSRATRLALDRANEFGEIFGVTDEEIALAYVFNNKLTAGAVFSANGKEEMERFMRSADIEFTEEQSAALDYPRTTMANLYNGVYRTKTVRTLAIPATVPFNISKIILGTAQFGTGVNTDTAFAVLDAYYAAGGRTIDTANVYGRWSPSGESTSELVIGQWVKSRKVRGEVQIITKGCHPEITKMDVPRVNAAYIKSDLAESLKNLDTDYIDIYQLHRDNPNTPVAEIMECLHGFVTNGQIRAISASNWTTARIEEANAYAKANGLTPFTSSEVNRSLAVMTPCVAADDMPPVTDDDMAYYATHDIPILAWGSIGGGYIIKGAAGKLDEVSPAFLGQFQNAGSDWRVRNTRQVMRDSGLNAEELCVAYITSHPVNTAAIIGASKPEQIKRTMAAANLVIPREMVEDLEYLPPHVIAAMKNGGNEDAAHPLDVPFDMATPLREMWTEDYADVLSAIFGDMHKNPAAKMAMGFSLKQLLNMPGTRIDEEKATQLLSALNVKREELLARANK